MKKERLYNIEFVRAICAIGIIFFHFSLSSACVNSSIIQVCAKECFGEIIVTVFFILSGGMLYLNNPTLPSPISFYKKRIRSLYPAYYLGYIITTAILLATGYTYYRGQKLWTVILTLLGVDGYFKYLGDNFYMLGEWFLGAIIILYLMYPILTFLINRIEAITAVIILGAFIWINVDNIFVISLFRNMISCILSFYLGMLFFKHRSFIENKWTTIVAALIFIVIALFIYPTSLSQAQDNIYMHLCGIAAFILLYQLGRIFTVLTPLRTFFSFLGGLSYEIFLFQHSVISFVLSRNNPMGRTETYTVFVLITIVTILLAWMLHAITSRR